MENDRNSDGNKPQAQGSFWEVAWRGLALGLGVCAAKDVYGTIKEHTPGRDTPPIDDGDGSLWDIFS